MERMQCDNCGHVYDKDEGDAKNNVAPGTAWADVPADFKCPECESELMVPKDDVTGMSFTKNTYSGKQKMKAGKIMNMPYVTIIKIGLSAKTSENMLLKDEEIPLDQLKKVCRKE